MKALIFSTLMLSTLFSTKLAADPLKVGDAAPKAVATTDSGASLSFEDVYRKNTFTLVYFYPKADTPGCTKQGCSLRDSYEQLTKQGIAVIGVSTDGVEAQKAFKDKYHLPFTLVADQEHKVIEAFGVPTMPGAGFARRQAFLVKDGKIVWADYKASTEQQAADVLKAVSALETK
jgi:thioredoxin-dependent peroxiredoxin